MKFLFTAACLLASLLPPAGPSSPPDTLIASSSRQAPPDFTLTDVYGTPFKLSSFKGKVVLLDFWATTCGGCKIELPWYVEFDHAYRDKGLAVIGLDMYGESAEVIKPFATKWNMTYRLAVGTDPIGDSFHLKEMPLTVLIDRNGNIAVSHMGIVDKKSFESNIQKLLHE